MSSKGRNRKVFILHSNDSWRHCASRLNLTEMPRKRCKAIKDKSKKSLFSRVKFARVYIVLETPNPRPPKIQWKEDFLGIFLLRLSSFALTFIGMLSRHSLSPLLFTIFLRCCRMSHQHRLYEFCIFLWVMQVHICVCCFYEYNVVLKTTVFMLFKTPNRWELKNAQRTDM